MTGTLTYVVNESRLDGTLLALCDDASPLAAATGYLQGKGFANGDRITVTGSSGTFKGSPVFCMTGAQRAS